MATATAPTDLTDKIGQADEETWKRLAAALGVASRQEAVELVSTNPSAAKKAEEILGNSTDQQDTLLTAPSDSLLTSKRKKTSLASLMYGKSSGVKW